MVQSLIVYRNPLEYAFWNGGFPELIPIFAGGLAFIAMMLLLTKLYDPNLRRKGGLITNIYLAVSAATWVLVTWYLWV